MEDDERGQPWLVMLQIVRDFALEQLEASGEAFPVWRRHAWYCLQDAEDETPQSQPVLQAELGPQLDRELGNFRAALDWCQAHGYADASLRLAADLEWFWGARGHITEGP
jgi:predicted ATPase